MPYQRVSELEGLFEQYQVKEFDRQLIRRDLGLLREKDFETFAHSVRTTLLSMKIAQLLGMDPKPLLFAGPRHDVGKKNTPNKVLKKKSNFTREDREAMKPHPTDSFNHLLRTNLFSAQIGVSHHRHGNDPYPKRLPRGAGVLSHKTKLLANKYSKPLAIADWIDAALFRKNSRFSGQQVTLELVKREMLKDMPKLSQMIEKVFSEGLVNEQMLIMARQRRASLQRRSRVSRRSTVKKSFTVRRKK
jgi:hypothetical protein